MKTTAIKHILVAIGAAAITTACGYFLHYYLEPVWPEDSAVPHDVHGRALPWATIVAALMAYGIYALSRPVAAHPAWTKSDTPQPAGQKPPDHTPAAPKAPKPGRRTQRP